jgi:hypothetical protein
MEEPDDLDDALWALVRFLDPEDTGEISGEPWMSPEFEALVDRLSRALSRGSSDGPGMEGLLVRLSLLDRTTTLLSEILSSDGELLGRMNALSRLIKAPYAHKPPSSPHPPSALSKRI